MNILTIAYGLLDYIHKNAIDITQMYTDKDNNNIVPNIEELI